MKIKPAAFAVLFFIFSSCTFDYGGTGSQENVIPDLVMENVEYARIRSSDLIAKFEAERAERYEKQGVMILKNFSFEQYGEQGDTANVTGSAGNASVQIESGDIFMDNGVMLEIEAEDIIIETYQLEWKEDQRALTSGDENEVNIHRQDGTTFTGTGLRADARRRTWDFSGKVTGTYVHTNDSGEINEE
ncbi:MAG: LPS export ABC transporter periplasmic protein LptC [Treponema sp.]|nr:LPS export ABC transporter periplasmic protein LptC [Treponema sp.]